MVVVVDAPSDRQSAPFLGGFRQKAEHAADIKAVIAWAREQTKVPVWLVGTSRGTQSVAFVATELGRSEGPDGIVLTSTIVTDDKGRPVPAMPVEKLRIPALVVHHERDGCRLCAFCDIPTLMSKLGERPEKSCFRSRGARIVATHARRRVITASTGWSAKSLRKQRLGFLQNSHLSRTSVRYLVSAMLPGASTQK